MLTMPSRTVTSGAIRCGPRWTSARSRRSTATLRPSASTRMPDSSRMSSASTADVAARLAAVRLSSSASTGCARTIRMTCAKSLIALSASASCTESAPPAAPTVTRAPYAVGSVVAACAIAGCASWRDFRWRNSHSSTCECCKSTQKLSLPGSSGRSSCSRVREFDLGSSLLSSPGPPQPTRVLYRP